MPCVSKVFRTFGQQLVNKHRTSLRLNKLCSQTSALSLLVNLSKSQAVERFDILKYESFSCRIFSLSVPVHPLVLIARLVRADFIHIMELSREPETPHILEEFSKQISTRIHMPIYSAFRELCSFGFMIEPHTEQILDVSSYQHKRLWSR